MCKFLYFFLYFILIFVFLLILIPFLIPFLSCVFSSYSSIAYALSDAEHLSMRFIFPVTVCFSLCVFIRCLWIVLSHILSGNMSDQSTQQLAIVPKGLSKESVEMLTYILTEIYNRNSSSKKDISKDLVSGKEETKKINLLEILYKDACVSVLSR